MRFFCMIYYAQVNIFLGMLGWVSMYHGCNNKKRSGSDKARTCKPSISSQALCMRGSRNFRQGGVHVSLTEKALTTFFLSSAYFTEFKWSISKNSIIFQGSRGGPTFSRGGGGSNFFQGGGIQLLIPYRNPYNL